MKVLLVLAVILWMGADAHLEHFSGYPKQQSFEGPPWINGKIHRYELTMNMTMGIPGMTSQVAKSLIQMDVEIRSYNETHYRLKAEKVFVSKPKSSAESSDANLPMTRDRQLEEHLKKAIRFIYVDGEVTSYTLRKSESLQSKTIKRAILRHLEMKIPTSADSVYPIVLNTTEKNELGTYIAYYGIIQSPYPLFPREYNVYNVSKTVDYEPYRYPSFHEHHNFASKGCPNLCRLGENPISNRYGAGCPGECEPNKSPQKASLVVHHNYGLLRGQHVLETIKVEESSVSNMYDQDITFNIESHYELKDVRDWRTDYSEENEDEDVFTDLNIVPTIDDLNIINVRSRTDITKEYQWIYDVFGNVQAAEVLRLAERILEKVSSSVLEGDIESTRGQEVTQDVARLHDILALLTKIHLETLWTKIVDVKSLRSASEKEKIKRQILLDVLPLCGTDDSIDFIKDLIHEKKLLTWEAKEVLEAIPANLIEANEKNIRDLWALLELPHVKRYHVLHSAAHLTLSRVIRAACVVTSFTPDDSDAEEEYSRRRNLREQVKKPQEHPKKSRFSSWFDAKDDEADLAAKHFKIEHHEQSDEVKLCGRGTVKQFLEDMSTKVKSATQLQEKVVYMMAIAHLGHNDSLQFLKPYVYGVASDIIDLDPADVDFIKSISLYSLHHIAESYPYETLKIVAPIYFNRTEVPKVRIAAFSVLIRCQPSLPVLQHVALDTWNEPSNEVGSYVYSALETFGNASTPCLKLTADRIKLVISQAKKYNIGFQHSKSIIKTFFDEIRNFELEKRFAVVQSNESFVPNSIYTALKYNIQSMKDILFQASVNIQGVNLERLIEYIDTELIRLKVPEDITPSQENAIFGSLRLIPRLPKELRISIYKKIFYASSYQYIDEESLRNFISPIQEYLREYINGDRESISGHLVKIFIPSSIHTVTYSSIGIPMEMRMKHPLIFSIKLEAKQPPRTSGLPSSLRFIPRVYYATLHRKTMMNIIDRHAYGVYQQHKHTLALPSIELSVDFDPDSRTLEVTSKFSDLPKRIYRHHSEAGTFETHLDLRKFYTGDMNREPIKTIPVLFKSEYVLSAFGALPVYITHQSENIQPQYEYIPRNLEDAIELILDVVRNPSWRRRIVDVTFASTPSTVNQITFKISYNKTLSIRETSSSNTKRPEEKGWWLWSRSKANDDYPNSDYAEDESTLLGESWLHSRSSVSENEEISLEERKRIYEKLSKTRKEVAHEFFAKVETSPSVNTAELRVEYNTTLDRMTQGLMAWGRVHTTQMRTPFKMCLSHVMRFFNSPSEFHYDLPSYTGQAAIFIHAISFDDVCQPLAQSDITASGEIYKVPSQNLFDSDDFAEHPDPKFFVPKSHEECMRDLRKRKTQSPACIAAVHEESLFNQLFMTVALVKEFPPVLQNITYKLERAIQDYYFANVDVNRVNVNNPPNKLHVSMKYIEKLIDEPVLDIVMKKPKENVIYRRVEPVYFQPISSVFSYHESNMLRATNNTYPPSCGLMKKHVRTFDMKMYPLPRDTCTYVLSTHCTDKKKFAITAKRLSSSSDKKEITIHLHEQFVILKPGRSDDSYSVCHNDKCYEVTYSTPLLLDPETLLHVYLVPAYLHELKFVLHLETEKVGIKIQYDGENVKLRVNPLYKGLLCGLCSDFDGEITREYRGPNQCLYLVSEDFAHSSIVDSEECGVSTVPKNAVICPSGEYPAPADENYDSSFSTPSYDAPRNPYNPNDEDDDDELYARGVSGSSEPRQRTMIIRRSDYVCFSMQPVPVCEERSEPVEQYLVSVNFHCLNKDDTTARHLIHESKFRILRELANKKVDFTGPEAVPRSCSPY